MKEQEIVLPLSSGMVTDLNPLLSDGIRFDLLENLYQEDSFLVAEPYFQPVATLEENVEVDGYAYSISPVNKSFTIAFKLGTCLYKLVDDGEKQTLFKYADLIKEDEVWDTETGIKISDAKPFVEIDDSSILQYAQWTWSSNDIAVSTAFFTKPGLPLTKFGGSSIELIKPTFTQNISPVYLSAKYILVTNDRMFLANCYEGDKHYPTRIHWSQINNPEKWAVESTSEADYFDLGINSLEITGLGYSNNVVFIFTRNSIWRSDYEGFDAKFRTTKFTSNTGCLYNYSAITVNEIIYFIGKDNIYSIDNLTITPIGTPIWKWFKENSAVNATENIVAQYEANQNSITWIFKRKVNDSVETWGLKYNITDKTWSLRNMQS